MRSLGCILLGFAMLAAPTGCSFSVTSPPPRYSPKYPVSCDSDVSLPVADYVGAAITGLAGLALSWAAARDRSCNYEGGPCPTFEGKPLALTMLVSGAYLVSGLRGASDVRACQKAKRRRKDWISAGRPNDLRDVERYKAARRILRSDRAPGALPSLSPHALAEQRRKQEVCGRWKLELSHATTTSAKLAVIKRRPVECRD